MRRDGDERGREDTHLYPPMNVGDTWKGVEGQAKLPPSNDAVTVNDGMLNGSFVFFLSGRRRLLINFWRNSVGRFAVLGRGARSGVLLFPRCPSPDCADALNHSMNTDLWRRMSCLPIIILQSARDH
ncbi:hypothetical protein AVEN_42687-1 [Araneus ventricosus]|uniref:Uncharacterized protein n=1 Tax=Araneus ventricosus TaxID=182803 RepID=A0A4Y2BLZ8_ARAVE|nr:hypothetical protein AVEN_42687-1 [Araneus ventricosus]